MIADLGEPAAAALVVGKGCTGIAVLRDQPCAGHAKQRGDYGRKPWQGDLRD
jgi:hypothetical protein